MGDLHTVECSHCGAWVGWADSPECPETLKQAVPVYTIITATDEEWMSAPRDKFSHTSDCPHYWIAATCRTRGEERGFATYRRPRMSPVSVRGPAVN
jgi:hypothetical protein